MTDNSEKIKTAFEGWFHELINFSLRSEWFDGDCKLPDEKVRTKQMYEWVLSAFVQGYNSSQQGNKMNDSITLTLSPEELQTVEMALGAVVSARAEKLRSKINEAHPQIQSLYDLIDDWFGDPMATTEELIDRIEKWLPKEQSAAGSQRVEVECAVDGFNDCLKQIKSRLR